MMIPRDSLAFLIDDDRSVWKSVARLLCSAGYTGAVFGWASDFLAREPYAGSGCAIVDVRTGLEWNRFTG